MHSVPATGRGLALGERVWGGVSVPSCAFPAVCVHTCQAVHECVRVHALGLLEGVGVRGCCDRSGRAGKGQPRWGAQHRSSSSPGVLSR